MLEEEEFKTKLHSKSLNEDSKIELIQWYIDNSPVLITQPLSGILFSKLEGVTIIKGGKPEFLTYAIKRLKVFYPK